MAEENKVEAEEKDKKKDSDKKIKRTFHLNKNVNSENVQDIVRGILEANTYDDEQEEKNPDYKRKPISLIISSYGGNIYDGMELVGVIDSSKTPIHGYCYSKAMSMGFVIFVVCHKRFAHGLANLMYHDGAGQLGGTFQDIEQGLDQFKKLVAQLDYYITSYTNLSQEKLDEMKVFKKNWYMLAEEAKENGIVDEILESTRKSHREKSA